ncbi:MAG: T9SS type A sorting domain-containing protein [Flavobacteriales bacterium]|nr:T9SS type A sorting domain-containing protein [Flavobacteriales bacterium]
MRYLILIASTLLCFQSSAETKRALFIGNSYTYYNTMAQTVADIAESMGDEFIWEESTFGGYTLESHSTNNSTLSKIEEGGWDFVIMQEQSQLPSFPDVQVEGSFYPFVASLVDHIHQYNSCAVPMLFMTWGREEGDAQNCPNWPPVCTYEGMQELLTERYLNACDQNAAFCAPVGVIWEDLFTNTDISLYAGDGSHPSAEGSFVVASTMYVAMFGNNPMDSDYAGSIDASDAAAIDEAVWNTWQNNPDVWRQYEKTEVGYTIIDNGNNTYTIGVELTPFVNSAVIEIAGEQTTIGGEEVITISITQDTPFTITPNTECPEVVVIEDLLVYDGDVGVEEQSESLVRIYPNPTQDYIKVVRENSQSIQYEIIDLTGKVVKSGVLQESRLELSMIAEGSYVLIIEEGKQTIPLMIQR